MVLWVRIRVPRPARLRLQRNPVRLIVRIQRLQARGVCGERKRAVPHGERRPGIDRRDVRSVARYERVPIDPRAVVLRQGMRRIGREHDGNRQAAYRASEANHRPPRLPARRPPGNPRAGHGRRRGRFIEPDYLPEPFRVPAFTLDVAGAPAS